jgi:putative redox protein
MGASKSLTLSLSSVIPTVEVGFRVRRLLASERIGEQDGFRFGNSDRRSEVSYEVETISVDGRTTALGAADGFTLVVDRPAEAGGGGRGFNGGQLLNLAVVGCISNDLFRESARAGVTLRRVGVTGSDYVGEPAVSTPIEYDVELDGDSSEEALRDLVRQVDGIAEIPNSIRYGTKALLREVKVSA